MISTQSAAALLVSVSILTAPLAAEAALSCSTATRRELTAPDLRIHSNRFREPVSINSSGDLLLVSRPKQSRDRLYLYPGTGPAELIASVLAPSPNGGLFTQDAPFEDFSISDAGHIAFFATTTLGSAIFVRKSGDVLASAVAEGQASPSGGTFSGFPRLSSINDSARVAFRGVVNGGINGLFTYDAVADVVTPTVLIGDTTLGGRQICGLDQLELASTGAIVFTAMTKINCGDGSESAVGGLFLTTGGGIKTVFLVGQPAPFLGTTFGPNSSRPDINSSENVAFHTQLVGANPNATVFFWNSATETITPVVGLNSLAPGGGIYRKFRDIRIADDDDIYVGARLRGPTVNPFGIFQFTGGVGSAALVRTTPPPADLFTPPSKYIRFADFFDVASDGRLGSKVRVRDATTPRNKVGVIRCA